jgi:hypothetical protein
MTGRRPLELRDVPMKLVPADPRLGGDSVVVGTARLDALRRSGPVLIGRRPDDEYVRRFRAEAVAELRQVLHVPGAHRVTITTAMPADVGAEVVAGCGPGTTVVGCGPQSDRWRHLLKVAGPGTSGPAGPATAAATAVAAVLRETPDWASAVPAGPSADGLRWRLLDLTRTTAALHRPVLADLDVAVLGAGHLFGVGQECTIVVLSERAARWSTERSPGGRGWAPDGLHVGLGTTDLLMLAHGVRAVAETDLAEFERAVDERSALVVAWAAERGWSTGGARAAGGDLAQRVVTTSTPTSLAAVGRFLRDHHLLHGLTSDDDPTAVHVGLHPDTPMDELERALGLVGFVVDRIG